MIDRVILIVLDSVGIGELPDAADYGDEGSNTVGNMAKALGGLHLPNLERLGLGRVVDLHHKCDAKVDGCYGRMGELSPGKDTTTGHWEFAGLVLDKPFPTYPKGFPKDLLARYENAIGRKTIGNYASSGTEILKQLGDEHCRTGSPIVYTSADSVFQVAAHDDVIPLKELYRFCQVARDMLVGVHQVGRVIARPFVGKSGGYARTANRRDFSVTPIIPNLLTVLRDAGKNVVAVGKIEDIFNGVGITSAVHTKGNAQTTEVTGRMIKDGTGRPGLVFTNLVDFDMLYGHRNDVKNYAAALKAFDDALPGLMSSMKDSDLMIVTADHGNDPTTPSTDHSREYVPLLAWGPASAKGVDLGTRRSFADLGQTIAGVFGLHLANGKSFIGEVVK